MPIKFIIKTFFFFSLLTLTACNGFFEKDNTPPPTPLEVLPVVEVQPKLLWSTHTGNGAGGEYLKMSPSLDEVAIYTTSAKGLVTAINKANGHKIWQITTNTPLSTGPGIGEGLVVVASRKGDVIALQQETGTALWKITIPGEVLAKPVVGQGLIYIKTVDGAIRALSQTDGHEIWAFQQTEPNLILRGSSMPILTDYHLIAGFANGNLVKLNASNGELLWQETVATPEGGFSIQRMIDIDADPILYHHQIYAATYQGRIASLSWSSGQELWSNKLSSYTGMATDGQLVYVSDAQSYIYAFNVDTGTPAWKQSRLAARNVSGPATMGHYIVLGDGEGYLHWLAKQDGHLSGRVKVGGSFYTAPLVENNVVFAFSSNGTLTAYQAN